MVIDRGPQVVATAAPVVCLLLGSAAAHLSWASLRLQAPADDDRQPDRSSPLAELLALLRDSGTKTDEHFALQFARLASTRLRAWC
ncbi:hypothetical protein [Azohydromonas lata]|uniref:Uncharacterized protein n=1 Tax=Azohydromonas lata TaxID=45677 RepID=A0ABU5I901_9BURK|nr:hypothetical protein [Azohydromonas lata]MDZ5455319.1 hypothetical protein [Azohydromonas lata]